MKRGTGMSTNTDVPGKNVARQVRPEVWPDRALRDPRPDYKGARPGFPLPPICRSVRFSADKSGF